ncbi:MAG TPA: hypothetical protein VFM18_08550 [Methanosarcina sp.]|nr:hypothetical protein [Methanosarcina sp.]
MKTSSSSILVRRTGREQSLLHKLLGVAMIVAILFVSLPAGNAFAAPISADSRSELRGEWKDKIQNVSVEGFFYERIRIYPADFKDPAELAQAHQLLNNYGAAYRAAGTLILNHAGFDSKGQVINEFQASQTIKAVAENLRIMRVMRNKLDGLEGDYRLLPRQS